MKNAILCVALLACTPSPKLSWEIERDRQEAASAEQERQTQLHAACPPATPPPVVAPYEAPPCPYTLENFPGLPPIGTPERERYLAPELAVEFECRYWQEKQIREAAKPQFPEVNAFGLDSGHYSDECNNVLVHGLVCAQELKGPAREAKLDAIRAAAVPWKGRYDDDRTHDVECGRLFDEMRSNWRDGCPCHDWQSWRWGYIDPLQRGRDR